MTEAIQFVKQLLKLLGNEYPDAAVFPAGVIYGMSHDHTSGLWFTPDEGLGKVMTFPEIRSPLLLPWAKIAKLVPLLRKDDLIKVEDAGAKVTLTMTDNETNIMRAYAFDLLADTENKLELKDHTKLELPFQILLDPTGLKQLIKDAAVYDGTSYNSLKVAYDSLGEELHLLTEAEYGTGPHEIIVPLLSSSIVVDSAECPIEKLPIFVAFYNPMALQRIASFGADAGASSVKLSAGTEMPLRLEYSFEGLGTVILILAPSTQPEPYDEDDKSYEEVII